MPPAVGLEFTPTSRLLNPGRGSNRCGVTESFRDSVTHDAVGSACLRLQEGPLHQDESQRLVQPAGPARWRTVFTA